MKTVNFSKRQNIALSRRWGCCFIVLMITCFPTLGHGLESYKQYYLDGLEQKNSKNYEQALSLFQKAMALNDTDRKNIRFYGMRFEDYMPHRESGICYYMLKQYREAIRELNISLKQVPSDETGKYIHLSQKALLPQKNKADKTIPFPQELKNIRTALAENRYAVAVVIGNRNYSNPDIPSVDYAINDAQMVKTLLIKTFGLRDGNIIFRIDATKGIFENIFGSDKNFKGMLYEYITPGKSDVFIYYSGHGAPSLETNKGYILPVDGTPNNVSISGYALELLYHNLTEMKARSVMVITDACFSGAPLFKKASPVGIIVKNPLLAKPNTIIFNSSSGTQLSSWYTEKGHGLFTYFFLLGLTGQADQNHDNQISLNELSFFLNDNVPYLARKLYSGRRQTPVFKYHDGKQILTRYK